MAAAFRNLGAVMEKGSYALCYSLSDSRWDSMKETTNKPILFSGASAVVEWTAWGHSKLLKPMEMLGLMAL